jgi:prefoldin subunit 5
MKIQINIDLQLSDIAELDTLTWFIKSVNATLNALESEIESYRQRLERVEEMTTRFESGHEEN